MKAVCTDLISDILSDDLRVALIYRANIVILIGSGKVRNKDILAFTVCRSFCFSLSCSGAFIRLFIIGFCFIGLAVLLVQLFLHCCLVAVSNAWGRGRLSAAAGGQCC